MDRILFLDDMPERCAAARVHLSCSVVTTAASCIEALKSGPWDLVYLDHDLGGAPLDKPLTVDANGQTGMDVVEWVGRERPDVDTFVVHSLNGPARFRMVSRLTALGYNVIEKPFTTMLAEWRRT